MKPEELYNLPQGTERSDTHKQARKGCTLTRPKSRFDALNRKEKNRKIYLCAKKAR